MQLVNPSVKYKESFIAAVKEYQHEKSDQRVDILSLDVPSLQKDFASYIRQLAGEALGKGLPKGFVPQTTYWLIDSNEFIGRANIRHRLTEHLLQIGGHIGYDIRPSKRNQGYGTKLLSLTLPKAKTMGITRVLITCDETNIGSRKVIEANGGILENSVPQENGLPRKLRFWIEL